MPAPETARIAWHTITAELSVGMLTLAFLSVLIKLLGVWIRSEHPAWRGLAWLAEPTAYLAAVGGLLSLSAGFFTGFAYTWPIEVLLTSSVVLNKTALSGFSLTFWLIFVLMRSFYGRELWKQAKLRRLYVTLAVGGFVSLALIGSTGGHLAGKRSALDALLYHLGIHTHALFILPRPVIYALLAVIGVSLALALGLRWRNSRKALLSKTS
ncbi:hypothetical protein LM602_01380 [Candidatus Acetothermia bacterium]|jgi:hypothetical protein|nr:hypothetical protein [Candidatus Acetothermia bacterium]MCI2431195.1 hypothetical protein [Candidatus Acetothermia bacterium]MCI2437246.1 hypothetical protein [Candidatus Acetothermia bacterium]